VNDALRFVLAGLATWRVTHLLAYEDGPGEVVVRLRAAAGRGLLGQAMDCFDCLSVWVAAPLTPFVVRRSGRAGDAVLTWLALSGAACLAERLAGGTATVAYSNDEEDDDELLR
jgi:hypothetical protein